MIKNKKGFTLVELMAVIVILIIIIFIAINKVNESVQKTKNNTVKANAIAYVKAVNSFLSEDSLSSERMDSGIFDYTTLTNYGVKVTGTKPTDAYFLISNYKVVSACIVFNNKSVTLTKGEYSDVTSDGCSYDSLLNDLYYGTSKEFAYKGQEDVYTVPETGFYKLEVWGAAGGGNNITASVGNRAGAGGYSYGIISLQKGEKLYINVGGAGSVGSWLSGGYNGGGSCGDSGSSGSGSGGGATHIATKSGLLSTLENDKDKVIIVAGGGGGSDDVGNGGYNSSDDGSGGDAGGYVGNYAIINGARDTANIPGGQDSGYQFGKGENVARCDTGGAGGGWYGGRVTNNCSGGGAGGSSYIGNTRLMGKGMYCYKCSESSDILTKTTSTTCASENPTANCAKKGAGYAKITPIKPNASDDFEKKFANYNKLNYIESSSQQYIDTTIPAANNIGVYAKLSSTDISNDKVYFGSRGSSTDTRLFVGNVNGYMYYGWNTNTNASTMQSGSIHEIKLNYLNDRNKTYDTTVLLQNVPTLASSNNKNLFVFALNDNGTTKYYSSIKLYELKISQDENIIMNLVPCVNRDNPETIGLCDLVSGQFFGNSGSGTFNYGLLE